MKTLKEILFDPDIASKDIKDAVIEPDVFLDEMENALAKLRSKYNLFPDEFEYAITSKNDNRHIYLAFKHDYKAKNNVNFKEHIYMAFYAVDNIRRDDGMPKIFMHPFRFFVECKSDIDIWRRSNDNGWRPPNDNGWRLQDNFYTGKQFYLNTKKYHIPYDFISQGYATNSMPLIIDLTYKNKDIVIDYIESMIKGFFDQSQLDTIDGYFEKYAEEPTKTNKITGSVLTKILKKIEK